MQMRNGFKKLQYLLLALSILALTGCGATNTTTAANPAGNTTKLTAKVVGLQSDNIATVRLQVTGATIPTARQDFAGKTGGTIEVYPGSALIVTAQAFDATNVMLSEGAVTDVTVVAGTPTTVTVTMNPPVAKTADVTCLGCHETTRDITGQNLVADYKQSGHYTNVSWTTNAKNGSTLPGCAGCHGTQHNDVTPATSGRCMECHAANLSLKHTSATALTAGLTNPARYLSIGGTNCSACHEPHNPIDGAGKDERPAWEASAHGDVNGPAWTYYDFTGPARGACARCHTTVGFLRGLADGFTSTADLSTTSLGKRPLTCDACHSDNKFTVRTAPAFKTTYVANGGSNLIPDVGESNLCIPCHTGRGSQADILTITDAAITNVGFKNPHYMAAAGIMYLKAGFINFTSAASQDGSTYYKNYRLPLPVTATGTTAKGGVDAIYGGILGGVGSAHRGLGTPTTRGGEDWMKTAATNGLWETNGPCVTCHINSDITNMPAVTNTSVAPFLPAGTVIPAKRAASGHSLSAVSSDAGKQLCMPCHNDAGDFNTVLNAGDYTAAIEEKMAEAKPYFKGGLDVIAKLLDTNYSITFDNATNPYFFKKGTTTAVTDWTLAGALTPTAARKLMGACYNLKLLRADEGAYIHGRSYTQRLIFDSIDFLDDGVMNASAAKTIVANGDSSLFPSTVDDHWLFKPGGARK
jgi:hypothetical protein